MLFDLSDLRKVSFTLERQLAPKLVFKIDYFTSLTGDTNRYTDITWLSYVTRARDDEFSTITNVSSFLISSLALSK